MSRRTVTTVVILALIAFGALYFWPKRAHAGLDGAVGIGIRLESPSVRLGIRVGDGFRHRPHHHHGHRHHVRGGLRRSLPPERNPLLIVPFGFDDDDDDDTIIVLPPSDPPVTPVAAPPPPPPQPLDPYGQARTVSAPGAAEPREWELGAALPESLPHVTLDPAAYGLPEPPPGQIYARVAGDVLRIDADTRQIRAVLAR